jgi:subtilase family serine protease
MQGFRRKSYVWNFAFTATSLLMLVGVVLFTNTSAGAAAKYSNRLVFGPHKANLVYSDQGVLDPNKAANQQFACLSATAAMRCYTPQQIRNAYSITPLLNAGVTGAGRTIVIIDAYSSPTIATDLKLFDTLFGLPDPKLSIVAPNGIPAYNANDPNQSGWAGEISLDVEWAHAVAPGAAITLVEAKSSSDPDLLSADQYVVKKNLGDVLSQSYGEGETCTAVPLSALHTVFRSATNEGITLFAASGDEGAAQVSQPPTCGGKAPFFRSASTPADDTLVTGVGGTQLNISAKNSSYVAEIALNETDDPSIPYTFASGGGFSTTFTRPNYQNGVLGINAYRGVPDVAYSAALNGGVIMVQSSATPPPYVAHVFTTGGTSAGSPQWAGIAALADQLAGRRLGFLNKALYTIGEGALYGESFHDITLGNNTFHTADNSTIINGYNTRKGWDPVTGWGTPNVSTLVPNLVKLVGRNDANGL